MAKMEIKLPDEFLVRLSRLGDKTDAVTEKVLQAGGEVLLAEVKDHLSAVVGKDTKHPSRSTGELENSLGLTSVKIEREGNANIKVGFSEPRSKGDSNAKIANILEYGKHGQPPKPFLKPAKTAAKSDCISAMQKKFDEEVSKL
mgnify:CR=1 FL=1